MARNISKNAKRANKPNPRIDRNSFDPKFFNSDPGSNVTELHPRKPKKKVELIPRNIRQEDYVDLLDDEQIRILFAIGSAGTGKSLLATLHALEGLQDGTYDKIVICRPNVGLDGADLGFLPGNLTEKLSPWCLPILDIIKEYYTPQQVEKMILDETIELISLMHLRGRTFKNCVTLIDEAQNLSKEAMKTILTRLGENSRIIVTGDLNQIDKKFVDNGLLDFIKRLKNSGSETMAICEFSKEHVERDPIVAEVLGMYGDE